MARMLAFLLIFTGSAFGQSTSVTITDSNGNQANGTINGSNVFFVDSNGNSTFGTIRNGNVFLNTSNGEITFGTIKNGNVFLTDQKGNTTGTIKNGYVFLNNSDGSTTTGTYNHLGNTTIINSTTTGIPTETTQQPTQQPANDIQAQQREEFESGYVVGQAIGNGLAVAIQKHHIKSFCKKNGDTGYWRFEDGSIVTCASINAGRPVREWPAQAQRPDPALQSDGLQAYDLMESLRKALPDVDAVNGGTFGPSFVEDVKKNWANMRDIYCKASPGAVYTDLQSQQQTCPH